MAFVQETFQSGISLALVPKSAMSSQVANLNEPGNHGSTVTHGDIQPLGEPGSIIFYDCTKFNATLSINFSSFPQYTCFKFCFMESHNSFHEIVFVVFILIGNSPLYVICEGELNNDILQWTVILRGWRVAICVVISMLI